MAQRTNTRERSRRLTQMESQPQKFQVSIRATVQQLEPYVSSGSLSIEENTVLTLSSFMDVAKVLSEFHQLMEAMRKRG